jgi:hypothetical protein
MNGISASPKLRACLFSLVICVAAWGALFLAGRAPQGTLWRVGLTLLPLYLILPGAFVAHIMVPGANQGPYMFLIGTAFSFVIYATLIYFALRGFAMRAQRREAAEAVPAGTVSEDREESE